MPTATLKLHKYIIGKEDDGWRGNGVDMYLGWIVQSPTTNFGGVSPVHGGLQRKNSVNKIFDDRLFSVSIPVGNLAFISLFMYESDESTEHVARAFQQLKVPQLSSYSLAPGHAIDWMTSVSLTASGGVHLAEAALFELMRALYKGKKFNTDDFYGKWTYALHAISDTKIEYFNAPNAERRHAIRNPFKGTLPTTFCPTYMDSENDVQAEIWVSQQ